jgi:hypothetical protein
MQISAVATKLLYTGIVALCDCLFLLLPFIWKQSSDNGGAQRLSLLTSFLGGALLSLAFVNLMSDSNAQLRTMVPDFPVSYVATVVGVLFTSFFPRLFASPQDIDIEPLLENDEIFELQCETTNAESERSTLRALFFVAMSLFESLTSNISIGMQDAQSHLMMLTFLIVISDGVQMISIGLAFERMLEERHVRHNTLSRVYTPVILLFLLTLLTNFVGTFIGLALSYVLTSPTNKWWVAVVSECMLAFNAGMFIKMSMVDMIELELDKSNTGARSKVFKRMAFICMGTAFGVLISVLVAPHT